MIDDRFDPAKDGNATIAEAAKYLRVCRGTVEALMRGGALPVVRILSCTRIPWPALRDYVAMSTHYEIKAGHPSKLGPTKAATKR